MKKDLGVWKRLYELSDELMSFKPWEHIYSDDFICVELSPDHIVYCTVMGKLGDCIGISIYEDEDGYADLCSLSKEYDNNEVIRYVMFDQNCLTWYMGDRDEVPREQLSIIKELGLKYRGKNQWPYFMRFEKRFMPSSIDHDEARRMIVVLERLIDILKAYVQNEIDVNFEQDEIIFAHEENDNWKYEAMSKPDIVDKYYPVELEDKSIFDELNKQQKTEQCLYIDLICFGAMKDKNYHKTVNALFFIVVDEESELILHGNFIKPEEDEIQYAIHFFINYILNVGRPDTIYVRNPQVISSLFDICQKCDIDIVDDDCLMLDFIIREMEKMM